MATPPFKKLKSDDPFYFLSQGPSLDYGNECAIAFLPFELASKGELDLCQTWKCYPGIYLFLNVAKTALSQLNFEQALRRFLNAPFEQALRRFLNTPPFRNVRFLWIENPTEPLATWRFSFLSVDSAGEDHEVSRFTAFDFRNYTLAVARGSSISLKLSSDDDGFDGFAITRSEGFYLTTGYGAHRLPEVGSEIQIPFQGEAAGCLKFNLTLKRQSELKLLDIGLRLFFKDPQFPGTDTDFYITSLRYPLFDEQDAEALESLLKNKDKKIQQLYTDDLSLNATLDPLHPLTEKRTYFSFVKASAIPSNYRTNLGYTVHLTPHDANSRLIFAPRPGESHPDRPAPLYLTPAGNFKMTVPPYGAAAQASPPVDNLICGLSGVEYIRLDPKQTNLLCFKPGQAAFAPGFKPVDIQQALRADSSGTSPANEESLTKLATTSWAYVRKATKPKEDEDLPFYYAQPDQAILYRAAELEGVDLAKNLLSYMEVPTTGLPHQINGNLDSFPLFPYAGIRESLTDYRQLEIQLLNPRRRARISKISAAKAIPLPPAVAGAQTTGTTPQGLLATYSADFETLQTLLLAKDTDDADDADLSFTNIGRPSPLRDALQSNQLFMVISNPESLKPYFENNLLIIQDWTFDLNPGYDPDPNHWHPDTILIFKFHDKPLLELVENPQMWAQPLRFNANPADTRDQLSQLIQDALSKDAEEAAPKDRENYRQLARAARNENWSGIIALNVPLQQPLANALPEELKAIAAGIVDEKFFAQYIGIETTPIDVVDGKLEAAQSSLFGLIDYKNEIIEASTKDYDFTVPNLQVLFQNSQVKAFSCELAVTLNRLFDEPTKLLSATSGLNIIRLKGSAENHNGQTTYAFSFSGDNHFALSNSPVLNEVEIIKAQFSTDPSGKESKDITGRFSFWGRLNFKHLETFDIFSFGAEKSDEEDDDDKENDKFLSFGNLMVTMTFPQDKPEDVEFAFDPRQLTFDATRSKVRDECLYAKFPLKLTGLTYSQGEKTTDNYGYMPVKSPLPAGKLARTWYGLTFDLDLGSMGALAGNAGLVVSLITAWSPSIQPAPAGKVSAEAQAGGGMFVGLRLPGSTGGKREISLQGVLKITFKSIEFVIGETPEKRVSYLLKLKNIMLKVMVLSLPPNARTEMTIFGNPDGTPADRTLGWYAAYAKEQKQQA